MIFLAPSLQIKTKYKCMYSSYCLGANHHIKPLYMYLSLLFPQSVQVGYNIDVTFQINCCFRLRSKGCCFDCVWSMACLGRVLFLQRLTILCIRLLWISKCYCVGVKNEQELCWWIGNISMWLCMFWYMYLHVQPTWFRSLLGNLMSKVAKCDVMSK